ncbi:MAG: UDP-3-O-(3-hydroxymyristoyl)glucosamine N-acyltransferase [Bacteroidales bacterium]|nr:UDP-3-O-(3-hydroxymyristoyl)glucosamine N-acyltransferase [Lentimicrobiaceae bacterium]MDD5694702.1 UDP-3-O-(3-hydroxymyristoyl)glucosamine N-acyltransferase [Bacteroidales bacterium]
MQFTAEQIAGILNGTVDGDPKATVDRLSKIEEGIPGTLSFLANPKYTPYIYKTQASIVIVRKDFTAEFPIHSTLIRVEDPYSSFARLLEIYNKQTGERSGISPHASVADTARIGRDVYIGDFCVVGEHAVIGDGARIHPQVYIGDDVIIGSRTLLHPGVKILRGCQVGNDCIVHPGVVIGSDGFGFAQQEDHHYQKIAQIGNVVIEDEVEIGANCTIDRATLGSTVIRKGVKLDNLIQVAHNVVIGENTVIAAQSGISGSTHIGKNCLIGGQAGITGHLSIEDHVQIAAQSGVTTNIKTNQTVMGAPAFDIKKYRISYIHFRNLEKYVRRIDDLEKKNCK